MTKWNKPFTNEDVSSRIETLRIIEWVSDLFERLEDDEDDVQVVAAIKGEWYALLARNYELRAAVDRLKAENTRLADELSATADDLALSVTTVEYMTAYLERSSRWRAPPPGTYTACTESGRCGRGGGDPCECEGVERDARS